MQLSPMLKRFLAPYGIIWKKDWCAAYALFGLNVCSLCNRADCLAIREWYQQSENKRKRITSRDFLEPILETEFDEFFT